MSSNSTGKGAGSKYSGGDGVARQYILTFVTRTKYR
jgi:hypothetical protein